MRAQPFENSGTLRARSAHAGLLLEKYIRPFETDGPQKEKENERRLATLRSIAALPVDECYRKAYLRWREMWSHDGEGRLCVERTLRSRLAIGMGAPSVIENGLRLHATYGVPMIPASSIKGALRARMEPDERNRDFLFGNEDETGEVVFQDAFIVPPLGANEPVLEVDVVTVHHGEYYGGGAPPTDFDSPNPVHFLTIRGRFLFVADAPSQGWRDFALNLLLDVLETGGLGGKRSAGYGRAH